MEVWKPIIAYKKGKTYDFTGKYEVSNEGQVRNIKTGKLLKASVNNDGYEYVGLRIDGKQQAFKVHRLVAMAFIPTDNYELEVNHKDEVRHNNKVENLEWVTHKENCNHGTRTLKSSLSRGKKIVAIKGDKVIPFNAINHVDELGFNRRCVYDCLNGNRKTHKGYTFKYAS